MVYEWLLIHCMKLPQMTAPNQKNLSLSHWTQCQVKVKVAQSCLTFCDPMSFTVPGILQARILEWAAYPFSSGSYQPRNQTRVTCIAGGFFTNWDIRVRSTLQNQSVSSVAQSCLTLCDPMDCSMPGFPVHHQLPEPTQSHVHCIGDVIQPPHLLSSPSPPTFNLCQHQSLFQWVGSSGCQSTGVSASASVLPMNIQDWFSLWRTGWISLQSKGLSRVFSNTTVQKHQFFGAQLSL